MLFDKLPKIGSSAIGDDVRTDPRVASSGPRFASRADVLVNPSPLVEKVIGCAIEVHRSIGPGLLESAYDLCLTHELQLSGINFQRDVAIPIVYKGARLSCAYRADFVIENELLIELKSVERLQPIHQAQVLTYMRLLHLRQGLLMNFNVHKLVDGLRNLLR